MAHIILEIVAHLTLELTVRADHSCDASAEFCKFRE